ncbi:MAG: bifunctional nuclease family protein [Chthonomonas sp.]|nr:bifunctional nuclease family protein [Chthonomonas sp.]
MPDEFDDQLNQPPAFFPYEEDEEEQVESEPVEVTVEGLYVAETNGSVQRFVMLADESGRRVPIIIGLFEATAISMAFEGEKSDRPMTHDLMRTLLHRLGGSLVRVLIDDIWTNTYYAKLFIEDRSGQYEVDCRPSDAIALALRVGCPIWVKAQVFDKTADG